jgi:ribosomal protein S18 acetylase RimI-like enzyme
MVIKMSEYQFTNALGYNLFQACNMHNSSFQGYFMPAIMNPEDTVTFWRMNHIDATRCVVMLDQKEEFVGIARMGVRGKRGWCGGFGIAPEFRGRGASKLLAKEMVRVARESGLERLQLEVLSQNERARNVYEYAGFVANRRLIGIEIAISELPEDRSTGVKPIPVEVESLLSLSMLNANEHPCWGREAATILGLSAQAYGIIGPDGRSSGLIVQQVGEKMRILATVFQNPLSDEEIVALLRQAVGGAKSIQVYNEPEDSTFLARCYRLGFKQFFSQYEMFVNL